MTEVEQLRKENQELREKVASFESKLEEALAWNAQLRQAMYGRKSEKLRVLQTDEKEISLFDEAENVMLLGTYDGAQGHRESDGLYFSIGGF